MGVLFESILLFSLAVLIILVGLLVYYFKKRIVDVEQKNATCLEIVQDVYTQHMKLRNEIYMMIQNEQQHHHTQEQPMPMYQHVHNVTDENRIKIELSDDDDDDDELSEDESEDESDEETSSDEESDSDAEEAQPEPEDKIKVINVDLKIPENFKINEIDEDPEEEPEEEPELKSLEPSDPIIINKVGPADISKQDLKKLTPSALKALLIGKGMSADEVNKMKKADLIKNLM
jgi:hypothetical protein